MARYAGRTPAGRGLGTGTRSRKNQGVSRNRTCILPVMGIIYAGSMPLFSSKCVRKRFDNFSMTVFCRSLSLRFFQSTTSSS